MDADPIKNDGPTACPACFDTSLSQGSPWEIFDAICSHEDCPTSSATSCTPPTPAFSALGAPVSMPVLLPFFEIQFAIIVSTSSMPIRFANLAPATPSKPTPIAPAPEAHAFCGVTSPCSFRRLPDSIFDPKEAIASPVEPATIPPNAGAMGAPMAAPAPIGPRDSIAEVHTFCGCRNDAPTVSKNVSWLAMSRAPAWCSGEYSILSLNKGFPLARAISIFCNAASASSGVSNICCRPISSAVRPVLSNAERMDLSLLSSSHSLNAWSAICGSS